MEYWDIDFILFASGKLYTNNNNHIHSHDVYVSMKLLNNQKNIHNIYVFTKC